MLGDRLADANAAFRTATEWLQQQRNADHVNALAGATPYLRLAGIVTGGWLLTKSALAAEALRVDRRERVHDGVPRAEGRDRPLLRHPAVAAGCRPRPGDHRRRRRPPRRHVLIAAGDPATRNRKNRSMLARLQLGMNNRVMTLAGATTMTLAIPTIGVAAGPPSDASCTAVPEGVTLVVPHAGGVGLARSSGVEPLAFGSRVLHRSRSGRRTVPCGRRFHRRETADVYRILPGVDRYGPPAARSNWCRAADC